MLNGYGCEARKENQKSKSKEQNDPDEIAGRKAEKGRISNFRFQRKPHRHPSFVRQDGLRRAGRSGG